MTKQQNGGRITERRPLVEGLKPQPAQETEKAFVYGGKPAPAVEKPTAPTTAKPATRPPLRVPVTSRVRADYAEALKRASLERQLQGVEPNSVQDILEDALGPWLKANGYLA